MPLEVPKFITDLATGLQDIAAQLDAALAAIQEKRKDFNTRVLTQLRGYHFTFTDKLADKLDEGVKNGKIRVAQAIAMVDGKGVFAALDELKKLKIADKVLDNDMMLSELTRSADNPEPDEAICVAYDRVGEAIGELGKDKAGGEKTKRKSAIATAIIAFKNAFVKYVAINKYGLNPADIKDGMKVDDLDAKNAEERERALVAVGLTDKLANAIGINKKSNDLQSIKIEDVPAKATELINKQLASISSSLASDERLGPQLEILGKKLDDIQKLNIDMINRQGKGNVAETTDQLEEIYKKAIKPETDEYVKTAVQSAVDGCDPATGLPDGLKGGDFEAVIRGVILNNIQRDEETVKERVWSDPAGVPADLAARKSFSESLKENENGLAEAYNTFSTKVAALAAVDKKLADKITGLVDTKMKNVKDEATVAETLNEIKKVLQKSTDVDFGAPAAP